MSFINWGNESEDQRNLRRRIEEIELFEQANYLLNRSNGAAAGGSMLFVRKWITVYNTAYIYPKDSLISALNDTNVPVIRRYNNLIFQTVQDAALFTYDIWYKTTLTQTSNNLGYSLGVGTVLTGSQQKIYLKLADGKLIGVWTLMKQLTDQLDLPSGGDSPQGTEGYGLTFSDWDLNDIPDEIVDIPPFSELDAIRFQSYS